MSAAPRLSVLMTVFNAGPALGPAVESVLGQGWGDFEFLIVDDASTDGSADVIAEFARGDARIRVFLNRENKGQTACLNEGLRAARAPWVARQDADDLSLPGRFAAQWDRIRSSADLVLIGTNGWIINPAGAVTGMIHVPCGPDAVKASLPIRNPFIHTAVMFRRELPGGGIVQYDESFRICQDWDLWMRMLRFGTGDNLPERLVAYRHSESSLSHAAGATTRAECARIAAAAWDDCRPGMTADLRLLEEFREGLSAANRRAFHELCRPWIPAGARAVHHIQAAGALAGTDRRAALAEIAAAFRLAPAWTWDVLVQSVAIRLGLRRGL